jgi:D-alanyl-D-alanine carboxypeptidase/D-alanyl-D-alanine-endopeptidase (penicillin-binding protein 4)
LKILGDSLPGLKYHIAKDSLIIWGTGDPSFLNDRAFTNTRVIDFLRNSTRPIYFSTDNFHTDHLGPGWAWDDYNYYFSSERSALPIYGNTIKVSRTHSGYLKLVPSLFKKNVWLADSLKKSSAFIREIGGNRFDYFPGVTSNNRIVAVPFHNDPLLTIELLSDTINQKVRWIRTSGKEDTHTLYSVPSDSLYRVMMQASDNFIAEQILMMCSGVLSDSLKPEIAIREIRQKYLTDLPDPLVWVDGSGLSRYNLFTPRSIVYVWRKLYDAVPQERLFSLLAVGGRYGTIRNYYKSEKPYIYGKTGTLSNNHCLSGFIEAKSGRILAFSFMSSNYTVPASQVSERMEEILKMIYEHY